MGDGADDALDRLMDYDELYLNGEFENPEWLEDGTFYNSIFHHSVIAKTKQNTPQPSNPNVCPKCGSAMVLKNGIHGQFYGCSKYPNCRGSRNAT